ncbi:MAG TPA: serine hydrolase [Pyrinomonadaceae bacterium]|nr:serine hydrolase [Pyrinomonadaceae bacterium]
MRSLILLTVILAFAVTGFAQLPASLNGFDAYAEKAMKDWEVPGMAIAIVKDDKIVFAKGFGVRKIGETTPVDEKTIFAIGSSSKAFTSAALATLVDEGKIKWDDRVSKYLPDFETYDPYVTRELTIRDLLTHRSGLERGDNLWYGTELSRDEILRHVRYIKPSWSLRSTFGYQNLMYLAAGQIVAKVTGSSWDDVVTQRIFTPLGMRASSTTISSFKNGDNIASPHGTFDGKVQAIAWRKIDNIGPAGSINSNVVDMAQWLRLQLGKGTYDNKKVFSAATSNEMHMSQTVMRLEGAYNIFYPQAHFLNYGMGWFLSDYRGKKLVEHGGAIDGMRAAVAMLPEEKVGVVILTNMNGSIIPIPLMYRIFDAYLGVPEKDWSGDILKQYKVVADQANAAEKKTEAERVTGTNPSHSLPSYVGTYRSDLYGDVKVTDESGKLKVSFGPAFNSVLEHWHYDTFRATFSTSGISKSFVSFALNAQGKVDTLTLGMPGLSAYPFKRVPDAPKPTASADNKAN